MSTTFQDATFQDAMKKYSSYPHNEETGRGFLCYAAIGHYCSGCGAEHTIAWICRHPDKVLKPYEIAVKTYEKWRSERWFEYEKSVPYMEAMISFLKTREEAHSEETLKELLRKHSDVFANYDHKEYLLEHPEETMEEFPKTPSETPGETKRYQKF